MAYIDRLIEKNEQIYEFRAEGRLNKVAIEKVVADHIVQKLHEQGRSSVGIKTCSNRNLEYTVSKYLEEGKDMLELTIYGMGFFLCTLLIRYMLFKVRKNHNHGQNSIWVGSRAILGLCFVGIINNKIGYLAAILGFICANEVGKAAGWH